MPPDVDVLKEEANPKDARAGTFAEEAARPSAHDAKKEKLGEKLEMVKGDKGDMQRDVSTRERADTPSGIGFGAMAQDTRFAFPMAMDSEDIGEEECADIGESDGEGGAVPCVTPERWALRPLKRFGR